MYISPKQKKKYILRVGLVLLGIIVTTIAGYFTIRYISSADEEAVPENVAISNLTTNSVTITWTTSISSSAEVVVITGGEESQPYIDTRGVGDRMTHFVEIIDLEPNVEYSFRIKSNGVKYISEDGKDFKFKTFDVSEATPVPNPFYGNLSGTGNDDAIIFVYTTSPSESLVISTIPSSVGKWMVDLSSLRLADGSLVSVGADTTLKIVAIGPESRGSSVVGKYSEIVDEEGELSSSSPLTLGNNFDLVSNLPTSAIIGEVVPENPVIPKTLSVTISPSSSSVTVGTSVTLIPKVENGTPPYTYSWSCTNNQTGSSSSLIFTSSVIGNYTCTLNLTDSNVKSAVGTSSIIVGATPVNPPPDDPPSNEEPEEREFEVRSDVPWENMIMGTSTQTEIPDVDFDEDSIKLVNLSNTTFGVVWLSKEKEVGYISYGTDENDLSEDAKDVRDGVLENGEYYTHFVEVTGLDPETEYYYIIYSGGSSYDDSGDPFLIKTFATLDSPPPLESVNGKVTGLSNYEDIITLVRILESDEEGSEGDSNYIAESTDSLGNWIANIGEVRTVLGDEYYEYTDGDFLEVSYLFYGESEISKYLMEDISTVEITSQVTAPETSTSEEVKLLDNYGVYSSFISTYINNGSSTPNTGINKSNYLLIFLFLPVLGILSIFKNTIKVDK